MNSQYPERKISILRKLIIAAAAAVIFAPVFAAAYYQATFGYHWLVVLFGASALTFVLAAIAVMTVITNASLTQKADRLTAWLCGLTAGIAIVAFWGVYVATFASHSAWGDAVSIILVRTFIFYPSSALSFLPVSDEYKASLLYQIAAAITLGSIIIIRLLLALSRHIVKRLRQQTSAADNANRPLPPTIKGKAMPDLSRRWQSRAPFLRDFARSCCQRRNRFWQESPLVRSWSWCRPPG